jgi:AcrR family transcriptional regulator
MRPSSKTAILDAAMRLAQRSGITSLTQDAAAKEAGLSKGGLIYHVASKEQLMLGVVEHITRSREEAMQRALNKPFEDSTPTERLAA